MDFPSSIQTDHDVVHLPIDKRNHFIVERNAVCSHGKVDLLAKPFFLFAAVGDNLLANIKIHERLAAEEIHFQMLSRTAALHQKIDGGLADGERHQHPRAVKITGGSKTVFAAQIAVVRNVQAKRFDGAAPAHRRRFRRLAIDQSLLF